MSTLIKNGLFGLFVIVLLISCTRNYEKINTNPNAPGIEKSAPDMLLTNAIESMTDRIFETFLGEEMGNCWVQHEAKIQYIDEDRYIPRVEVINNTWSSFYAASGEDIESLYKIGLERDLPNYQGVALVLHVYVSAVLTDLFGDIPYSDAWQAAIEDGNIVSPKYDTQESIYAELLSKLDKANSLMNPTGLPIAGDILYGGDILKWKKFANSLKMRLLLRISDRKDPSSELQKILNDPSTYPIFENNNDDAQLNYLANAPNNNPRNENRKTRDDHRVSKTLTDLMWTNSPYADWRICIFAEKSTNGNFEGVPNGLSNIWGGPLDYFGCTYSCASKIGSYFTQGTTPGILMSYSEVLFILTEAAHKGYIPGGDAAAGNYYVEAIHANYNHYGQALVDLVNKYFDKGMTADELADDFLINENHAWDPAQAMRLIGEEKWVTLFDQGLEAWTEWRRLDYPKLKHANNGALGDKMPVRIYYPSDEAARNLDNLRNAKVAQGINTDSDLLTKVWWDVN